MDKFPITLSKEFKEHFPQYLETHLTAKLRLQIYEFMLQSKEDEYFILNNFFYKENIKDNTELTTLITNNIIKELNRLGWTTKLAFGGTSIYIYSTVEHKSNYFEDIIS